MVAVRTLVECLADTTAMELGEVVRHARYAREACCISQGGRGRGAAQATSMDAAILLSLIAADGDQKFAAKTIDKISAMEFNGGPELKQLIPEIGNNWIRHFENSHCFVDGVTFFIDKARREVALFEERLRGSFITFEQSTFNAQIYININTNINTDGSYDPFPCNVNFELCYCQCDYTKPPKLSRNCIIDFAVLAKIAAVLNEK